MSIPANSARHVVGWLACAVPALGSAGVRRHAGAHKQGRGRVGGRAGAGGGQGTGQRKWRLAAVVPIRASRGAGVNGRNRDL